MTNKNPFSLTTFFFLALLFVVSFFLFTTRPDSSEKNQAKLIQELKSQIKQELTQEFQQNVETLVKKQVEQEIATYLAKNAPTSNQELSQIKIPEETINQAVARVIKEALANLKESDQLTNDELDEYVASGGIDFILPIGAGLTKIPQADYMLAANESEQSTKTNQTKKASEQKKSSKTAKQGMASKNEDPHETSSRRVESIEKTLQQKGSVLLPKGTLVMEPSISWSQFSSNKINVNGITILDVFTIGTINGEIIKRDILTSNLGLKYGFLNNLQTELRIPYRYQYESNTTVAATETTRSAAGIGDIEFGVSRQVGWEHGAVPDLIANVSLKSTTGKVPYNNEIGLGSGHWTLRSTLIAAKSSDPVVIFGSLGVGYPFENSFENFGDIKPGNSIAASIGTAIALSYQTAINFSFDQSFVGRTTINGREVPGSLVKSANFKSGFTWALNERSSIDFGVSIGLTKDSPDVTVDLRFPYTF